MVPGKPPVAILPREPVDVDCSRHEPVSRTSQDIQYLNRPITFLTEQRQDSLELVIQITINHGPCGLGKVFFLLSVLVFPRIDGAA